MRNTLDLVDRFSVPDLQDQDAKNVALNVEDDAEVTHPQAEVRRIDESLDVAGRVLGEIAHFVEDPACDRSVQFLQLTRGRVGPDDFERHQKPSSPLS